MLNNSTGMGIPIFFFTRGGGLAEDVKLNEDSYEVFVEGQYVGDKTLYAQNEDFHDIGDFLERQGFQNLEIELKGDHIIVHADNDDEKKQLRQALEVYLKNR
ncbi:hypothetical protein DS745_05465 [Anaerobacillus alkaliphilus]|uniref:Uncharacterized protein n=1 Tax=Anaerobacillus alkaliphilus TaxID=1548597 RepID=A0A4Q0VWU9_9BACI|nr:hypothetical protein [Anaerobacillus alkaliphilus]RXJ02761.1 hypothetical protein DS745_05465 [Anaerobacillus alkaliphilus]